MTAPVSFADEGRGGYARGVLYCLIATISWGSLFPVMTTALTIVDPFTFTSFRYGGAALVFIAFLYWKEGAGAFRLKGERRVWLAWLLGSVGFAGFGFFVFLGQQMAGREGALTASIMMATQPMLSLLVNWAVRRVRPPLMSFAFILLSFTGVVLVITKGDFVHALHTPQNFVADALIVLGAFCWVIYTIGASAFPEWSPYRYTTMTTVLGMSSILTINVALFMFDVVPVPSTHALRQVSPYLIYTAGVPGFIGVLCWNLGNKIITPVNGVLFMDVVPLTAFMISAWQGVLPVHAQILGACFTAAAIVLNNLYLRKRTARSSRRA